MATGTQPTSVEAPDWLTRRGGGLKQGSDRRTWYVLLNGEPLYSVTAVPVAGQHGPVIKQTNNGKRIDSSGVFATADDAVRGGLEDLRKAVGW